MTYREFMRELRSTDAVKVLTERGDKPALREVFSRELDCAHRAGRITDKQVNTWVYPRSWE